MTSIVDYRPASASDVPAIAGLHADSWRRNYRGAFADSFLDGHVLDDRLSVWGQRLAQPGPGQSTVVAEDDGVVVGFAHTVFDDHPTWGALLRTASSVLARTQPTGLYLWVLEQNTAAQAFYGSLGGTDVERGFGRPPGGGRPPRIRYAWPDPAILLI
jgi:hypothetical protein